MRSLFEFGARPRLMRKRPRSNWTNGEKPSTASWILKAVDWEQHCNTRLIEALRSHVCGFSDIPYFGCSAAQYRYVYIYIFRYLDVP